jgi:hypothetical protein
VSPSDRDSPYCIVPCGNYFLFSFFPLSLVQSLKEKKKKENNFHMEQCNMDYPCQTGSHASGVGKNPSNPKDPLVPVLRSTEILLLL